MCVSGLPWRLTCWRIRLPKPADVGWIPESERPPGEGQGNPLQCSCLEIPRHRGAWRGYRPWGSQTVRHNLSTKQQQQQHANVKISSLEDREIQAANISDLQLKSEVPSLWDLTLDDLWWKWCNTNWNEKKKKRKSYLFVSDSLQPHGP